MTEEEKRQTIMQIELIIGRIFEETIEDSDEEEEFYGDEEEEDCDNERTDNHQD
jgi:hypothetical protein